MARNGILAAGNWIIDHVKIVDRWPEQDSLSVIESQENGTGGSPYNLLVGLARLKAPFPLEALGRVGEDPDGRFILGDCMRHGIQAHDLHPTPEAPTSYTDVMTVRATGRRTFFHHHGANALLDVPDFNPAKTNTRIFHLGYLMLLDRLDETDPEHGTRAARVLAAYQAAGLKTSVDVVSGPPERFAQIVPPSLKRTDYAFLNEWEAAHATGVATRANEKLLLEGVHQAAQKLLNMGVREWVILHFPEGAYALGRDGQNHFQSSLRLPEGYIRGTVGAGDAFCGGVLHGLHEGRPIPECLKLGVCNSAVCLAHPTSTQGILPLKETLALGDKLGYHAPPT